MKVDIEPVMYDPGEGDVRIEGTLIIASGAPKIITPMSKELRII